MRKLTNPTASIRCRVPCSIEIGRHRAVPAVLLPLPQRPKHQANRRRGSQGCHRLLSEGLAHIRLEGLHGFLSLLAIGARLLYRFASGVEGTVGYLENAFARASKVWAASAGLVYSSG